MFRESNLFQIKLDKLSPPIIEKLHSLFHLYQSQLELKIDHYPTVLILKEKIIVAICRRLFDVGFVDIEEVVCEIQVNLIKRFGHNRFFQPLAKDDAFNELQKIFQNQEAILATESIVNAELSEAINMGEIDLIRA